MKTIKKLLDWLNNKRVCITVFYGSYDPRKPSAAATEVLDKLAKSLVNRNSEQDLAPYWPEVLETRAQWLREIAQEAKDG